MCFRYGGDEFVILMPETAATEASSWPPACISELMHTRFHMKNGLELSVSASVGLANCPLKMAPLSTQSSAPPTPACTR